MLKNAENPKKYVSLHHDYAHGYAHSKAAIIKLLILIMDAPTLEFFIKWNNVQDNP